MTADLPVWIPADAETPPALPPAEGQEGRVVVLLSTEGALASGWAASLAVDLVDAWSRPGTRVVVADAGLSTPLLHEALGIPNHEGLVDALRWGASVPRVIRRPAGRGFLALTAGTAVADGAAVLGLPRWEALCAGFREAGVTLVVLVPAWEDGLAAVLEQADGLVVLAERGEDLGPVLAGAAAPVFAVTGRDDADSTGGGLEGLADLAGIGTEAVADEAELHDELPPLEAVGDGGYDAPVADPPSVGVVAEDDAFSSLPQVEEVWAESPTEAAEVSDEWDFEFPDETPTAEAAPASDWGTLPEDAAPLTFEPEEDVAEESASSSWDEDLPADDADPLGADASDDLERDWAPVPLPVSEPGEEDEFVLPDPIPVPPSLEEIVEESEASHPKGRSGMLLLVLLAVVVAVVSAGWLGYVDIPGITPARSATSSPPVPVVAAPMPPTEVSPAVAYSLALEAYQDGVVAGERVASLAGQVPGILFQSVPVEIDGTLFYRVLAGPAADSAAVFSLASHIAEVGQIDPSAWVPRWTPLAFQLGEMPDLEAADRRVAALNGLGVSAYVLAVDYSDGSVRYRVFAGAFADATEASYLSGLLDERSLSATLSDRIGRLPE